MRERDEGLIMHQEIEEGQMERERGVEHGRVKD